MLAVEGNAPSFSSSTWSWTRIDQRPIGQHFARKKKQSTIINNKVKFNKKKLNTNQSITKANKISTLFPNIRDPEGESMCQRSDRRALVSTNGRPRYGKTWSDSSSAGFARCSPEMNRLGLGTMTISRREPAQNETRTRKPKRRRNPQPRGHFWRSLHELVPPNTCTVSPISASFPFILILLFAV